jgi:hypothetical protein
VINHLLPILFIYFARHVFAAKRPIPQWNRRRACHLQSRQEGGQTAWPADFPAPRIAQAKSGELLSLSAPSILGNMFITDNAAFFPGL